MQIFIKNSADGSGKTFTLDVEPSDTICVLRRLVCAKAQIPPEFQRLRYAEKILGLERVWGLASGNTLVDDDTQTLESYGIAEGATLTLSCRGTRKRELVPDELSWASTQKRRALSNAVEPHARRANRLRFELAYSGAARERLRSERDEALAARERLTSERNEAQAASERLRSERDEARTARDEALAARDEARAARDAAQSALAAPRCSGIAAGSVVNMSDTALEQLHEELLSAQAVLARDQQRRLDTERDSKLCIVCLDRPRMFMSRACNHLTLCEACLPDGASPCPVCRVETSQWDRVYA